MKKPQVLSQYADENNLLLYPVKYTFKNYTKTGWDLCKPNGQIVFGIEPKQYRNGYHWFVRFHHENYKGPLYFTRISKSMLLCIDPSMNTFYKRSL